jgi:hypothetical protein
LRLGYSHLNQFDKNKLNSLLKLPLNPQLSNMPPAPTTLSFNTHRARSYVVRLPLFTRAVLATIILFWILGLQTWWDVRQWGALIPSEISFATRMFPVFVLLGLMFQ